MSSTLRDAGTRGFATHLIANRLTVIGSELPPNRTDEARGLRALTAQLPQRISPVEQCVLAAMLSRFFQRLDLDDALSRKLLTVAGCGHDFPSILGQILRAAATGLEASHTNGPRAADALSSTEPVSRAAEKVQRALTSIRQRYFESGLKLAD